MPCPRTLLAVLLLLTACHRRDLDAVGTPGTPLVFLLSPAHAAKAKPTDLVALQSALARETGLAVEVRVAPDESAALLAVGRRDVDAGIVPLWDFLFLHQEYDADAALRLLREGGSPSFSGEILVRADSGLQRLEDLAGRSIAFVDRYSTSGFVLPARALADAKVRVKPIWAGSHAAALDKLRAGVVDAACTYHDDARVEPGLRSLAATGSVPNEPVFLRHGLKPELRAKLVDALLRFAATSEGQRVLADVAGITGFVPADNAAYREAFDIVRGAGRRVEDLVVDGWQLAIDNQRPLSSYAP